MLRNKRFFLYVIIGMAFSISFAFAKPYSKEVRHLKWIKEMPYGSDFSGDQYYWDAVKCGLRIIPTLLEAIDHRRPTRATVYYFGGNFTLGDIAFHVMAEIIHGIPAIEFTKDWSGYDPNDGYGNYWRYVRDSEANRISFQEKLRNWYSQNSSNLLWIEDKSKHSNEVDNNSSRLYHPAGGYYEVHG